jgi:quaternary ammonium compound-resistance protein SugE
VADIAGTSAGTISTREFDMAWAILIVAGLLEAVWVTAMKFSQGFTRLLPSLTTFAAAGASFWLLAYAMRTIPLSTAYPVWTGVGAACTLVAAVLFLGETISLMRVASIALIIIGIAGLRLS